VLDFSGPTNYLGPSPKAVEIIKQHARLIKFYPDPNPVELKTEIGKYVGQGVDAANIILGNGSIELIYLISGVFASNFKAVIPVPSFTEYEKAALRFGGEPVFVQLPENFALETASVKKSITDDTRIVCICNPHSPSGALYRRETVLDLVDFCQKRDVILSVDENYIEFTGKAQDTTMAGYVKKYENLFVIRSVTKFYGMPGIRLGYGIAAERLIDTIQVDRQPWSINGLAGFATLAAFKDTEFIENTKRTIAKERVHFAKMLGEIGDLYVFPSETNFLLVKILNPNLTSTILKEQMAKEGILIRDCSTFVGLDDSFFRVTVRSSRENGKLIKTLRDMLKKKHN
jgi:threonine-phosphate decarboxylase